MTKKSTKKYYWLKLHKDFFKRKEIVMIENMPRGVYFIHFYLKLLLESVESEGKLRFSDTIPYDENMLAYLTNTDTDIVKEALEIFENLHMIDIYDDKTLFMTELEKMVGSESEWAQKKREYRLAHDKTKEISEDTVRTEEGHSEDNVLDNVRQEIRDKSIEYRDIEIDKDINIKRKGVSKDTPKRKERNIPPSADEEEEHSNTRHNFQEVTKAWNELKPFGVNSVTKVVPTTERGKCLKARIADYGLDDVLKAIDLVKQSKFLQGNNDRDWKITFDWFVKPNNFIKVLEGNYTDTKPDNPNNFENRTFATAKERQMAEWEATFGSFDD